MKHPEPAVLDVNAAFRGGARSIAFLDRVNMASIVMLDETGIVPAPVAARVAAGMAELLQREQATAERTTADYLDYEPRLEAIVGPDASRLHTGRSRQDIASTIARMNLRDGLVEAIEAAALAREGFVALARGHVTTIVPAYTHGVQAQPHTFAHYLHAFAAALGRQCDRMWQAIERVNRSPLGAAALATSGFALDRERLAALLGFDGLVDNAYDANHLAPVDSALDVAAAYAVAAVQAGQFAQDIHVQYADPAPWILLGAGRLTGVSSIMPQKRNPAALEQLRAQASLVLGEMQSVALLAHNARTGMFDYRMYDPVPVQRLLTVLRLLREITDALSIDPGRARAEVDADYSTMTEIADALMQIADVPFRVGHHFASRLTDFGRSRGLKPSEIAYADAARVYAEQTRQALPLGESQFRRILNAEHMVHGRAGRGGPQPAEVERMLDDEAQAVARDRSRLDALKQRLAAAEQSLDRSFGRLAARGRPGAPAGG